MNAEFRAFVEAKIAVVRVLMTQREGESVGDAIERTDGLYGRQEAYRATLAFMDDLGGNLDNLRAAIMAALPHARGSEHQDLQTAQQLLAEFDASTA